MKEHCLWTQKRLREFNAAPSPDFWKGGNSTDAAWTEYPYAVCLSRKLKKSYKKSTRWSIKVEGNYMNT